MRTTLILFYFFAVLCSASMSLAQQLSREQWGAPVVSVSKVGDKWIIVGKRNRATLNADLSLRVETVATAWNLVSSGEKDMLVRSGGTDHFLRLASARKKTVSPYDTGFKTGVKITLSNWGGDDSSLTLTLTVCLQGKDEELVFDTVADERGAAVRQLDWPTALDARTVDYTVLSNGKGTLLPRDWPKEYYPIRTITPAGKIAASDHSLLQSHVIESWSMSWWGFQKDTSSMMVIVDTPDDAAYQFSHPAGGPTVIGPRWLETLGHLRYPRAVRMCFLDNANYVGMAKRYRRYVMDSGLFVSLKEKIARTPEVAKLIGTPQVRASILRDLSPVSDRYDTKDKSKNYSLTTFDERIRQLRDLKAKGVSDVLVMVTGWPHLGYDHQHPDPFPPPEGAGGWAGLKRLADTCRELGYTFMMHDQYRDYYTDAPSYSQQFAIHEEDSKTQPVAFAGSRFGDSKEGQIPFMSHWDGGKQTYLNARFQLGHLLKNYQLIFDNRIKPDGIYIDVVGYVPPDEDYNSEHPTTRTEAMSGQIAMLNWSRQNLGVVMTEAGSDWVIPYVDSINSSGAGSKAISIPLYQLVYHDAVVISYGFRDRASLLHGLLFGGAPEMPVSPTEETDKLMPLIDAMAKLHKRVGLLEMTVHEFLDPDRKREKTTFSDGTTVMVDWNANKYEIRPELN